MRILHLLSSNSFSGAENVACQIISMMNGEQGIEMFYCSPYGPIKNILADKHIQFFPISSLNCKEIRHVVKANEIDLIHAHDMKASVLSSVSCLGIPIVSHIHNNNFDSRRISVKSIAFLISSLNISHIFWVSQSAFEGYTFSKQIKKKSSVLKNIVDEKTISEKTLCENEKQFFDLVYCGRLAYPKNPLRLIQICDLLKEKYGNIRIAIIGTGDLEAETREKANILNLDKNITFYGFQQNPLKIVKNSKLLILTSDFEGLPMCALEALALGVPVFGTPTDGLKEIIVNGYNGYLDDDNEVIVKEILAYLSDSNLQKIISKQSLEFSKKYNDKEKYIEDILNVYLKV